MTRPSLPQPLLRTGVVAILRRVPPATLVPIVEAMRAAGVGCIEVTLDSEDALGGISQLADRMATDDFSVGAGTVLSVEAAAQAVEAGAAFLVTPSTNPAVLGWAVDNGIPLLAGALTPTEIVTAWDLGAAAVKVFPVSSLGPAYIREVRGPLAHIPLVPTGGIDPARTERLIADGAIAVGAGGWLIGDGDVSGISSRSNELIAAVANARTAV